MPTPKNGPLGLISPTPSRQEADGNPSLQPEKQVQPEKQGSPPEPENPPFQQWFGLISKDGFNRISVLAYDEAEARAKVDLELRKRSGMLWREWKDNGERVTTDDPALQQEEGSPPEPEERPASYRLNNFFCVECDAIFKTRDEALAHQCEDLPPEPPTSEYEKLKAELDRITDEIKELEAEMDAITTAYPYEDDAPDDVKRDHAEACRRWAYLQNGPMMHILDELEKYEAPCEPIPARITPEWVQNYASKKFDEGREAGIGEVISYLAGRLGDNPLISELEAHFEGGAK